MTPFAFDLLESASRGLIKRDVSIIEFAESDAFCNAKLYPGQRTLLKLIFLEELDSEEEGILENWINGGRDHKEILISPMIRERTDWLRRNNYPNFREIVLVGGRRGSKGFVTAMAATYQLYRYFSMENPADHFGIKEGKQIYFGCIAASQDQAKRYQYADLSSIVSSCKILQPYLRKTRELEFSVQTPWDVQNDRTLEAQGVRIGKDTSTLRGIAWAANAKTVRGSATAVAIFDEQAHMQVEGDNYMTASAVYDAVIPALAQFRKYAMIFDNSSPYTKVGKFYERYTEALLITEDRPAAPMMFTLQFPSWAMYSDYKRNNKWGFKSALMVSPDWNSDEKYEDGTNIHSQSDKDQIIIERINEIQDPDTYKVEYRSQWAEVMDSFLRPEIVDRAFLGRPTGTPNVYETMKTNWLYPEVGYEYIAHLDPAATTARFGFALGHVERIHDRVDIDSAPRSHVVFDVIRSWQANQFPGAVIEWEIVAEEITQFMKIFRPSEVTLDQFNSTAIISWLNKWLREHNMNDTRVYEKTATAMQNWKKDEAFRTALSLDLVHFPSDTSDCDWLNVEMKHLQVVNTAGRYPRIDHPSSGYCQSCDIYDSVSHVSYALIGNVIASETRDDIGRMHVQLGSQGGYRIGGKAGDALGSIYAQNRGMMTFKQSSPFYGGASARERIDAIQSTRSGTYGSKGRRKNRRYR